MFLADGSETEAIDVMHYVWNGAWPENRSPRVDSMRLDGKALPRTTLCWLLAFHTRRESSRMTRTVTQLQYRWEIMRESEANQVGGDKEPVPEVIARMVGAEEDGTIALVAPAEAGAYRLFVYVYDGNGHAGHANIPFLVK